MSLKNRTFAYACIQGFFWMCYAAIMGFVSMYLLDAGCSNSRVGVIIAGAGLVSALVQPMIAGYADKPGSMSLKMLLCISGGATLLCAVGLILSRGSVGVTAAFYALCMVLLQLATPLVNSLGVATVNSGEHMNFGIARGFGSLGYAAAAYLIGMLADAFGAVTVPVCMAVGFALFLLSVGSYGKLPSGSGDEKQTASGEGFFKKYPRYGVVLAGCVLLFVSHVVLNSFTYQIVVAKGGGSEEMGAAMAFASAIELPVMFLFGWMLKKAASDFWFRISGMFFMLKCLGTLLCTTIPGFYAVQLFQVGGWALITVSSVFYINAIMAPEDTVKGQAYYTVSMTLGNVAGAVVAGRILDALGVQAMLIFGTVCAAVGAVILLVFSQKTEKVHG